MKSELPVASLSNHSCSKKILKFSRSTLVACYAGLKNS